MRWFHWMAFGGAFAAATGDALAGKYGDAIWPLLVCVWVYIAAGEARDAARYRHIRLTTTAVRDSSTQQNIPVTPPELDEAIDRMINK